MQFVAFINQKGGSGKTTTAMNLAGALAIPKTKLILVDLDHQASATRWAAQGRGLPFAVVPLVGYGADRFKQAVKEATAGYDLVILDTPPGLASTARLACLVADLVLIPVTASPLDVWASQAAVDLVHEARKERRGKPLAALVPSRLKVGTSLAHDLPSALRDLGELVAPPIYDRVVLAKAALAGQTIEQYQPGERAALEFVALAEFVRSLPWRTKRGREGGSPAH